MKCPRCRADNPDTSRFCSSCAAPLGSEARNPPSVTKTKTMPVSGFAKESVIARKYKILDEAGRGGMGIVYKAEDIRPRAGTLLGGMSGGTRLRAFGSAM